MIEVPSHQVVEFLDWLSTRRHDVQASDHLNRDALLARAQEYVHVTETRQTLAYLLRLFQSWRDMGDDDLVSSMRGFVQYADRSHYLLPDIDPSTDRVPLHPLLLGYLRWAEVEQSSCNLFYRLSRLVSRYHDRRQMGGGLDRSLYYRRNMDLLREVDLALVYCFEAYLVQANPSHVESFARGRHDWSSDIAGIDREESGHTRPLGINESSGSAAERLVGTVLWELEKAQHGEDADPVILRMMANSKLIDGELAQELEFLAWLTDRYPNLTLLQSVPLGQLPDLVMDFCEEKGYSGAKTLTREITRWVQGDADGPILRRFLRLNSSKRRDSRGGQTTRIDRYQRVPFHGLFLFLSVGDYQEFVRRYWKDLNALSADWLDIYYSDDDLRAGTSGFDIAHQLRSVAVPLTSIPALVLWATSLDSARTIPFGLLDHDGIFRVLQLVVQRISEGKSLDEVADEATETARKEAELPLMSAPMVIENLWQPTFAANSGIVSFGNSVSVTATQVQVGNHELTEALQKVISAIATSAELDDVQRGSYTGIVNEIASEVTKPQPDKTRLQVLGEGLKGAVTRFPTVAQTVGALVEILNAFVG